MTRGLYAQFFETIGLRTICLVGVALAAVLYPFGAALSLGLLYGIGVALLELWVMLLGLKRVFLGPPDRPRALLQWWAVQSYLGRYLLLGVLLWVSLKLEALDFYAAAGGVLLPRVVLWVRNAKVRRSGAGG